MFNISEFYTYVKISNLFLRRQKAKSKLVNAVSVVGSVERNIAGTEEDVRVKRTVDISLSLMRQSSRNRWTVVAHRLPSNRTCLHARLEA